VDKVEFSIQQLNSGNLNGSAPAAGSEQLITVANTTAADLAFELHNRSVHDSIRRRIRASHLRTPTHIPVQRAHQFAADRFIDRRTPQIINSKDGPRHSGENESPDGVLQTSSQIAVGRLTISMQKLTAYGIDN
jgi:hypothetical protein